MTGAASASIEARLRELDAAIEAGVSARDAKALDRILGDDFIYTHAGGTPEAKREFIATVVARDDPPRRTLQNWKAELHADVAVTRATIEFVYSNGRPNLYLYCVRVYRQAGDDWRAISHCSFFVAERG
jgi:hypothetical protein